MTPKPPLLGGFLAFCSPSLFDTYFKTTTFHSKAQLKTVVVGLWVLAACAGRSTRKKAFGNNLPLARRRSLDVYSVKVCECGSEKPPKPKK